MEAEQSVLGAIMLVGEKDQKIREVFDLVSPEMFFNSGHQAIFRAMQGCSHLDMVTVSDAMGGDSDVSFSYLGELQKNTPSASNIMQYVEILRSHYRDRITIGICNDAAEQIYSGCEGEEAIRVLKSNIESIDLTTSYEPKSASEMIPEWMELMDRRVKGDIEAVGVKTGIHSIDNQIGGIGCDWLVVLAGRPSNGKSLIAQLIAANISAQFPVLDFQMEMGDSGLFDRYVGLLAGVNPKNLREGQLSDYEWSRTHQVLEAFNKGSSVIHIDDTPALSVEQIKARSKSFKKKHGKIGLITIDYLGLMKKPKADRNDLAIGEITRQLKELAKEIQTPILLLAQANRGADQAHRLTMQNLKDSSSIEADADLILFAHREEVNNPETAWRGVIEIVPAKFRHGTMERSAFMKRQSDQEGGRYRCLTDAEAGFIQNEEDSKKAPTRFNG